MSPWAAPLAVAAAILWGWVAVAKSLSESLWLDELHSAWCASGTSEEVFHRAALGNQLSPYFWLLRSVSQTFGIPGGTSEAVWRAPSVIGWLGVVVLCGWTLGRIAARGCNRGSRPLVLLALALVVLDRLQIFYATEARPYALVALTTLLAWTALSAWSWRWFPPASLQSESRWQAPMWLAWCLLNTAACWLQPTAVFSVAAQYVFLLCLWFAARRAGRADGGLWPLALGALAFALTMFPALHVLWPVWEHRQRWAAFASGTSLGDVLLLLPFVALVGPLAIGTLLHWVCHLRQTHRNERPGQRFLGNRVLGSAVDWLTCDVNSETPSMQSPARQTHTSSLRRGWWMWLLAWSLPCLMVYGLTASGIAPLMHRRYVFLAAAPLVLWTASSVAGLRGRGLRFGVLLGMIATLLVQQGSLQTWRQGSWPAAVRGEDWRGAVRWINSLTSPERPVVVFCASNLIEGAGPLPPEQAMREYLTLPLRSIYRARDASRIVPLANDPTSWASTVVAEMAQRPEEPAWLVVRCSATDWERRLQASGLSCGAHRGFGGVQVARDVGFKKMP